VIKYADAIQEACLPAPSAEPTIVRLAAKVVWRVGECQYKRIIWLSMYVPDP
jgi:hypothetical protein